MRTGLVGIALLAACFAGEGEVSVTSVVVPEITSELRATLMARAFVIGCDEIACRDRPIFASDLTPGAVRGEVDLVLEVEWLSDEEALAITGPSGEYPEGGSWVGVDDVRQTEREDVVSVMTYVHGAGRNMGTETLFQWQGDQWAQVTSEEVSVTVITAVP